MKTLVKTVWALLASFLLSLPAFGQGSRLQLHHADNFEIVLADGPDTTFVTGSVRFEDQDGLYHCDSATWVKGVSLILKGNVIIDGKEQRIIADSVNYNEISGDAIARGDYVEIWSYDDSILAVGTHAFFSRSDNSFFMDERPTLFLKYPDSNSMVEVIADRVDYFRGEERAEASGQVQISSQEFSSTSNCAVFLGNENIIDLSEGPVALHGQSRIEGSSIIIATRDGGIDRIDVIDSAKAELVEVIDSVVGWNDRSTMSGERIQMDFIAGELSRITCFEQSYSSYYPSPRGGLSEIENKVSGDTIMLHIQQRTLTSVEVFGGAVGTYLEAKAHAVDSETVIITDTVDYEASYINYEIADSLISMNTAGKVRSGQMELNAFRIEYDTRKQLVKAFSAEIESDSATADSTSSAPLQPNPIPVALQDGGDIMFGDYLEYSIETKKGRILKSKTNYETGFFYGKDVYKQTDDIVYLSDGKYTTCDADEPHFHFSSKNLKIIQNEKLIAKPVVFNIGRIPIFVVPYYVFPLKKGRHSGLLPFTLGNIEQGERYIRNLGYYVAASEYWDWQGSFDFFEQDSRLNFYSRLSYNKRYKFSGNIRGNWGRSRPFNFSTIQEDRTNRWTLEASHKHELSSTFRFDAFGKIQSDATFFNDFSTSLNDRLDRDITSKFNFTKKFSRSVTLSGGVSHVENLDARQRTTNLPTLNLSLPTLRPFGEGGRDEAGNLKQSWFNNITVRYNPNVRNFSNRITIDSLFNIQKDTVIIIDSLGSADTTISTTSADTVSFRSRKKYARIDHNPALNLPTTRLAKYLRFTPSFRYSETWYKIIETDQSLAAGLSPSTFRAYSYSLGASLTTDLYGTVYPNLLNLIGLRQVLTPSVSYRFAPKIDRVPEVRAFAGGGPGNSRKSQTLAMSLRQVYQAKIRSGIGERTLELMSISSSINYDIENDTRHYSNLSTTFRSYLLPNINFDGSMTHSVYEEGSDELSFFSPTLENFRVNANINITGKRFLFDDEQSQGIPLGADSASKVAAAQPGSSVGRRGWSLRANYSYSQSGRGDSFIKSSFIRFTLGFNLTKNTTISYNQYYNFNDKKTVNNQVNITRRLHAWTGNLFWVPVGSNSGFGFRLFVNAIPAIKFDNSQSALSSSYFQDLR